MVVRRAAAKVVKMADWMADMKADRSVDYLAAK
jgi:hypothetical protein